MFIAIHLTMVTQKDVPGKKIEFQKFVFLDVRVMFEFKS